MKIILFSILSFILIACGGEKSKKESSIVNTKDDNPDSLNIPDGFDYKMDRNITFKLQVLDHNGVPGKYIGIKIYEPSNHVLSSNETPVPSIAPKAILIYSGQTNESGYLEESVTIPMHLESVQVQASQLGINNLANLAVNKPVVFHEFK